jgi:hypothetical protein
VVLHDLHFEEVIGTIEILLLIHFSPFHQHYLMLAPHVLFEFVSQSHYLELYSIIVFYFSGTFVDLNNDFDEFFSLFNDQGIVLFRLQDIFKLFKSRKTESLDLLTC